MPELVAGFEMTSWTNDGVIRQASLQEVRERTDKTLSWVDHVGNKPLTSTGSNVLAN